MNVWMQNSNMVFKRKASSRASIMALFRGTIMHQQSNRKAKQKPTKKASQQQQNKKKVFLFCWLAPKIKEHLKQANKTRRGPPRNAERKLRKGHQSSTCSKASGAWLPGEDPPSHPATPVASWALREEKA